MRVFQSFVKMETFRGLFALCVALLVIQIQGQQVSAGTFILYPIRSPCTEIAMARIDLSCNSILCIDIYYALHWFSNRVVAMMVPVHDFYIAHGTNFTRHYICYNYFISRRKAWSL